MTNNKQPPQPVNQKPKPTPFSGAMDEKPKGKTGK